MFVTLDKFFADYRIKNGQNPNETVFNAPLFRLKREIRELKSLVDILMGDPNEEWNPDKIYEIDEYVTYNGYTYRSNADTNYGYKPDENPNWWTEITCQSVKDKNRIFNYGSFVSQNEQTDFELTFNLDSIPAVFVDGTILGPTEFSYDSNTVSLVKPCIARQSVIIISGVSYESVSVLPKLETTAKDLQTEFTTTFDLASPYVFVDGLLLQSSEFSYGKRYLSLNKPLNYGQRITIGNGAPVGSDTYTKEEINALLENYYTKDLLYTKEQIDHTVEDIYQKLENLDKYALKDEVYTRTYLDNKFNQYMPTIDIERALSTKANKASTLSGYGITDAYTQTQVKNLLDYKLNKSDFNQENVLNLLEGADLNASTLNGLTSEQFMRSDTETENVGGIKVYSENKDQVVNIDCENKPNFIKVTRDVGTENEKTGRAYTELNSNGLIFIAEGDFEGTWYNNIYNFGVVNPKEYIWVINIIPSGTGQQFDFVPKGFGTGFKFTGFSYELGETGDNEGAYFYGMLRQNIVKLFAYVKTDDSTFIPAQAHYQLIGYHKNICSFVNMNEGDQPKDFVHFNHLSDEEFQELIDEVGDTSTPEEPPVIDDDALYTLDHYVTIEDSDDIYQSEEPTPYYLTIKAYTDIIPLNEEVKIYVSGGQPNTSMSMTIKGSAEFISQPVEFNGYGEAVATIHSIIPYLDPVTVTATSPTSDTVSLHLEVEPDPDYALGNAKFAILNNAQYLTGSVDEDLNATITDGNTTVSDIVLGFGDLPTGFIGKEITITVNPSDISEAQTFNCIVTEGDVVTVDGQSIEGYGIINLTSTEGHDLKWFASVNGSYTITLTYGSCSIERTLTIALVEPTFGFNTEDSSMYTMDEGTFVEEPEINDSESDW